MTRRQQTIGLKRESTIGVICICAGIVLSACGAPETAVTTETEVDDPRPQNSADVTAGTDQTAVGDPQPGDSAEVRLELGDCRNDAGFAAFDTDWAFVGPPSDPPPALLPQVWEGLEYIDGVIEFESFDESTFTAGGESILVAENPDLEAICFEW